MKFARAFKAALLSGEFPEEWCNAAIPYPALKKCLNKIRAEFQSMGLDADSLRQLLEAQVVSSHGDQIPLARYKFDVSESDVRPHFTVFVDLEDGVIVDASLSTASRAFLEKYARLRQLSQVPVNEPTPVNETTAVATVTADDDSSDQNSGDPLTPPSSTLSSPRSPSSPPLPPPVQPSDAAQLLPARFQRVDMSLAADSEFFQIIYHDMAELERIGQAEQAAIVGEVQALGKAIEQVARPEQKRWRLLGLGKEVVTRTAADKVMTPAHLKYASDLRRWRALFELYLDAQVFFSTRERDHGKARTAAQASWQLDWFQEEVRSRGLVQQFQLPASMEAYRQFLLLNKRLYLNLRFRELNQMAQTKILKKFDKWTALGVSRTFPDALSRQQHHDPLVESMARDVCARIAEDVVAVVPRLEDYMCPVCLSLAWLPVRLRCQHVFCVRCVIRMQRDKRKFCPLCRGEVVMEADLTNLDEDLEKFLKLYFRKEAKEKQQANEYERVVELFGEGYKSSSCALM